MEEGEGQLVVYAKPTDLDHVRKGLEAAKYTIEKAELSFEPETTIEVTDESTARKLIKLMDALDELDDVTNTYANFDIAPELMDKLG